MLNNLLLYFVYPAEPCPENVENPQVVKKSTWKESCDCNGFEVSSNWRFYDRIQTVASRKNLLLCVDFFGATHSLNPIIKPSFWRFLKPLAITRFIPILLFEYMVSFAKITTVSGRGKREGILQ